MSFYKDSLAYAWNNHKLLILSRNKGMVAASFCEKVCPIVDVEWPPPVTPTRGAITYIGSGTSSGARHEGPTEMMFTDSKALRVDVSVGLRHSHVCVGTPFIVLGCISLPTPFEVIVYQKGHNGKHFKVLYWHV